MRLGCRGASVWSCRNRLVREGGALVMCRRGGRSKRSKSDPNGGRRSSLVGGPELITKKIKRAKTDPERGLEFGNPDRPETDNLLGLYAILSGQGRDSVAAQRPDMGWGQFKPLLAEAAVSALEPIQGRYK